MRRPAIIAVLLCAVACLPRSAAAQAVGVRAGVSGDPNQFYAGVHVQTGPVFDRVFFRPNVEFGVGEDRTLAAINFDLIWRKAIRQHPWSVLIGGGPSAVIVRRDGPHGSTSDGGGGLNVLLGLEHAKGFFTELKVGLIDSPGIKFGIGYTFK